ncbi:MAG: RagB/SusD family nutrient uptake outer membrane protein [Sphingobacterium sp.]|uniref:RagB/SusD family nutrient uptake outer membrane protein n=1 Tax=Sphingobacterium sp. JB170 TaxID=1434842 RepID=UPI00097E8CE0|nr:RagB/SusD family nutrient uptake outer membrane protein [Sphingobacterium sp. JB170]SJN31214.1 Putative outer membrane protein, probably involved in nutrient binding [Sphingobacterium sp. JB170]
MKKYIKITAVALSIWTFAACNKHLDFAPEDFYADGNYWQNETQIDGFMTGIHSDLRGDQFTLIRLGEMRGGGLENQARMDVSLSDLGIIEHNLTEVSPGIAHWGGFMNTILQINLFINKVESITFLSEEKKGEYLGQAYGLRAFFYFHLLRTYGGVPLRLTADVILNKPDPVELRLARSTEAEVLTAIKSDIASSLLNFGSYLGPDKTYWNLNATRMLKGEVYLWSAKVYGNTADLTDAKSALNDITGYNLLPDFADVVNDKRNDELILTIPFSYNEANMSHTHMFTYAISNFNGIYYKDTVDTNAETIIDPLDIGQSNIGGIQRYAYTYELFQSYDLGDQRRDVTFYDFYAIDRNASPQKVTIRNTVLTKFLGEENNNIHYWDSDWPIYREADRLLMLGEIANAEGGNPAQYIQPVRDRAYRGNDPTPFVNRSKDQNELAILEERNKEFVFEGKRWYDIRRMTYAGKPFVFESASHPYGVLNESTQAYKVLWPVGNQVWTDDPLVDQTPGYPTTKP